MRGPTHLQRKESEKHPFRGSPKKPEKCQFLTDSAQNVQKLKKGIIEKALANNFLPAIVHNLAKF